jgi:transposase-like protein
MRPTPKARRRAFLEALSGGLSVTAAAVQSGMNRATAYRWRDREPSFAADWDAAIEAGTDRLEDVARQRAEAGSDTLLIFLLKARRPAKYRDRAAVEVTGKDGGPLVVRYPVKAESADAWQAQYATA